jgi:gluconolactonase
MKSIFFITAATCIIAGYSCTNQTANKVNEAIATTTAAADTAVGKIEIYDSSAIKLIDSNATLEVIGKNFTWSEGPVWIAAKQMLLFTDVPENKIFQWKAGDTAKLYLTPSGYTSAIKRDGGEDGANGLALDKEGRLLLCQSGNRQVVRLNTPLDSPKPDFTVLSANYNGKKYNSPNDLVTDSKSNIYFTDPIYGLPKRAADPTRELKFEGVYKIDATGTTSLLLDSIPNPNGIALSLDEKVLYVASSEDKHPKWFAYQLDEKGNIKSGGVLLDGTALQIKATVKQGADGFKLDKYGNIFSAGPDGVNIISPAGKLLGLIKVYVRRTSNCAFNETKDVLYITADDIVLRVKLHG